MLNTVIIVGRITDMKEDTIKVSVTRGYKNEEGSYDNDIVPVKLVGTILTNTKEYCKIGDVIGVKGCIETTDNGVVINAQKITFLASKK